MVPPKSAEWNVPGHSDSNKLQIRVAWWSDRRHCCIGLVSSEGAGAAIRLPMPHFRLVATSPRARSITGPHGCDIVLGTEETRIGRGVSGPGAFLIPKDWVQISTRHCRVTGDEVQPRGKRGSSEYARVELKVRATVSRWPRQWQWLMRVPHTLSLDDSPLHSKPLPFHPPAQRKGFKVFDSSTNGTFVDNVRVPKQGTADLPVGGKLRLSVLDPRNPQDVIEYVYIE